MWGPLSLTTSSAQTRSTEFCLACVVTADWHTKSGWRVWSFLSHASSTVPLRRDNDVIINFKMKPESRWSLYHEPFWFSIHKGETAGPKASSGVERQIIYKRPQETPDFNVILFLNRSIMYWRVTNLYNGHSYIEVKPSCLLKPEISSAVFTRMSPNRTKTSLILTSKSWRVSEFFETRFSEAEHWAMPGLTPQIYREIQ